MPRYVVVDSQNKWLEVGEYDTPEEALIGGMQSNNYDPEDKPFNIWVYAIGDWWEFVLDPISGEYTKEL